MADHPVRVPPELFAEWLNEAMEKTSVSAKPGTVAAVMADRAAQWGADQELEACCEWLGYPVAARQLRSARRPKPPTLAEQGLKALGSPVGPNHVQLLTAANQDDIRTALTRLAELEAQQ